MAGEPVSHLWEEVFVMYGVFNCSRTENGDALNRAQVQVGVFTKCLFVNVNDTESNYGGTNYSRPKTDSFDNVRFAGDKACQNG